MPNSLRPTLARLTALSPVPLLVPPVLRLLASTTSRRQQAERPLPMATVSRVKCKTSTRRTKTKTTTRKTTTSLVPSSVSASLPAPSTATPRRGRGGFGREPR